jgi:hypothetical protein
LRFVRFSCATIKSKGIQIGQAVEQGKLAVPFPNSTFADELVLFRRLFGHESIPI